MPLKPFVRSNMMYDTCLTLGHKFKDENEPASKQTCLPLFCTALKKIHPAGDLKEFYFTVKPRSTLWIGSYLLFNLSIYVSAMRVFFVFFYPEWTIGFGAFMFQNHPESQRLHVSAIVLKVKSVVYLKSIYLLIMNLLCYIPLV